MVKTLDALLALRRIRDGASSLTEAVDPLEDAIECLDQANHYLLTGKPNFQSLYALSPSTCEIVYIGSLALIGAICLSHHMPQRKRLVQGYAMVGI